jgi:hypothetical protein
MQHRYDDAAGHYEQALPLFRQFGARLGEANTLISRARLAMAIGAQANAVSEMATAIRVYTTIGLAKWAKTFQAEAATWETSGVKMSNMSL